MSNDNAVQVVTLLVSTASIPVWVLVGRCYPRVGWYAALPLIISALTSGFYLLVLLTDLNEQYTYAFVLMSSWLRLFVNSILLCGGGLMLWRMSRRAHE
jgi:hypothetical protein